MEKQVIIIEMWKDIEDSRLDQHIVNYYGNKKVKFISEKLNYYHDVALTLLMLSDMSDQV